MRRFEQVYFPRQEEREANSFGQPTGLIDGSTAGVLILSLLMVLLLMQSLLGKLIEYGCTLSDMVSEYCVKVGSPVL